MAIKVLAKKKEPDPAVLAGDVDRLIEKFPYRRFLEALADEEKQERFFKELER